MYKQVFSHTQLALFSIFITWQLVSTLWLIYTQDQNYLPDNKHLQNSELCMTENFVIHSKGKGKVHLRAGHEGPQGEYVYCCSLSLTSVLDGDPQSWNLVSPQHYVDESCVIVITDILRRYNF
jgi:hypothetical protein